MAIDALQERFIDEIKLRGYDDKYIDKNEEREILQIAIHQGVTLDAARTALTEVSATLGYVLETELMKLIKEQLDISIAGHAGVDQNAYEAALNRVRGVAQGRRSDRDLKRLVVNAIEDYGMKIKRGWLFNWYKAIKREVGEA